MSRKNRRFPFERTHQEISFDHLSSTSQQLYPILRDYLSVSRVSSEEKQVQQEIPSSPADSSRLNALLDHLKTTRQQKQQQWIDPMDFPRLRQDNIQYWKSVKQEWLKYYREENKREEIHLNNLMNSSSTR